MRWLWNGLGWGAATGAGLALAMEWVHVMDESPRGAGLWGALPLAVLIASGLGWSWRRGSRPVLGLVAAVETLVLSLLAANFLLLGTLAEISFSPTWWKLALGIIFLPVVLPFQAGPLVAGHVAACLAGWAFWTWQGRRPSATAA